MTRRALFFVETPHRLAGSQKALLAMLGPIREHGVEPLVVFPAPGVVHDAFRDAGLPCRILPAPERLLIFEKGVLRMSRAEKLDLALRDVAPYSLALARLARRERIEVAHFNLVRGMLLGGAGMRAIGVPSVLHLHGMPNLGSPALVRVATTLASRLVLCAEAIRPALDARSRAKATTVHNGMDLPPPVDRGAARAALLTLLGCTEPVELVITLSTRTAFKGLHHLVDAVAALRRRGRPIVWALLGPEGEASYVRFLDARIRERGLADAVRVLGFRRDAPALLAGADVFVLPTIERETLDDGSGPREVVVTEGLPMAVLESLAVGVPAVASDVAGVAEQLDEGRTGRLVPPGDADALARAIASVLDDTRLRAEIRREGPRVVAERFSLARASAGLAAVLRDA